MNRLPVVIAAALVVAACAKKADENANTAADTTQAAPAPAGPKAISLADIAGTWKVQVMPVDKDTVVNKHTLWASNDTSQWKLLFDGRTDTIKVRVLSVAGDSIVTQFGPYSSALRKNVKVVTDNVIRLQGSDLVGNIVAHYSVTTPDSVLQLRAKGTRAQ